MKTPIILAILGTAIGFAAGFFVGQMRNETAPTQPAGEETLIGRAPAPDAKASAPVAGTGASTGPVMHAAPAEDADYKEKDEFVKDLAGTDPQKAIAWAQANSDDDSRDELFESIAEVWAKREPEAAFTWANGLSLSQEREDAILGVMKGALEAGHETVALSFVDRLPPGEYQDTAMVAAVKHFAATDLDRAIGLAGAMGETYAMRHAGRAIAEALFESGGIEGAKQRVTELPYGSLRRQLTIGMAERLSNEDVGAVIAWIDQRPTSPDGSDIFDSYTMQSISYNLTRDLIRESGPIEALTWADDLGDTRLRSHYLERLGEFWGSRSPQEASEWLINSINERGFDGLQQVSEGIFEEWIEVDQSGPFEMIESIADPESRKKAAFMALHELAHENPRIAAERLAPYLSADPEKAGQLTSRLMQYWLRRDPEQASIWLNELPPGAVKDRGVERLVSSLVSEDKDAESARAWLGEIQNQEMQSNLLKKIEALEGKAPRPGSAPDPFAN